MGSGGSKACYCGGASSSSSGGRKGRAKKGSRVFQSYCLGTLSASRDSNADAYVCDNEIKESGGSSNSGGRMGESDEDRVTVECHGGNGKVEKSEEEIPCVSFNMETNEWRQSGIGHSSAASASGTTANGSSHPGPPTSSHFFTSPSRFLSRLSFIPGSMSFRLSRAASLGSSRAFSIPNVNLRMVDGQQVEICGVPNSANGIVDRIEAQQSDADDDDDDDDDDDNDDNLIPVSSNNVANNQAVLSTDNGFGSGGNSRAEADRNLHFPGAFNDLDGVETRTFDRRVSTREPVEGNIRFSRTLSVGRLRDRVLRRSSIPDFTFCPLQRESEVRDENQSSGRQDPCQMRVPEAEASRLTSGMSSSFFGIQDHEVETSRTREARYHDLREHRSNFLERRRRIRSQVRALQRLGNRFENLSGHERSCLLSGQHRTGCCTCRATHRDANLSDDTSARASISRIVMLAEALFEVLDEIHQQSVILSSRPSVSLLGSVPAPNEVVESLPVKLYTRSKKYQHEEAAQCYICLVEYDEGDHMRILPCHHEFHITCIDKWLKEIHRVCPLCRGDICRSDSLPADI